MAASTRLCPVAAAAATFLLSSFAAAADPNPASSDEEVETVATVHTELMGSEPSRLQSRSTLSGVFQVPDAPAQANLRDGYTFLTLSLGLRIFIMTILALHISLMLRLTCSIIKHRKVPSMQLSQPSILAFFTMSGVVAIGGCYLLIPWSDWSCTFRQPVILTALSLSGSILAGRVWRISTIMSPVLSFGGGGLLASSQASESETFDENGADDLCQRRRKRRQWIHTRIVQMKCTTMDVLSNISNWRKLLRCLRLTRNKGHRRRNSTLSIRRQVPLDRLLFLVFVLLIPQLTLQIMNIAVPVMRESRATHYDDEVMVAFHTCDRSSGPTSFIIGVLLALFPYFLTYLLSFDSSCSLPDVFDELNAFVRACHIFFVVTFSTVPAAYLSRTPDAHLYIITFLVVFGTVTPPVRFIVLPKLIPIWRGEKTVVVTHLLRRLGNDRRHRRQRTSVVTEGGDADGSQSATHTSDSAVDRHKRRSLVEANEKSANLALTIAKMYEDIGQSKKTVKIYDDALNLWKTEHNRRNKPLIGDYTEDEINAMESKELTLICRLLIAKGRVLGSLESGNSRATAKAAEAWLDSLDIFAYAPAASNIKDRSIIFPCFSGIFLFLKGGKIQKPASFEPDLVRRFVVETKKHYELSDDPVHYARALAMQSEILAKESRFDDALEAFATMKTIYDVDTSDLVSKHYGTDRCAQAYAFSALWYIEVGKEELGMRTCEYVIDAILDKMDPSNVLNFNVMLLPIIKILKSKGEAKCARELYQTYVIANYEKHFKDGQKTPAKPLMKPMMLLLKICEERGPYKGMDADIEYMAEDDHGTVPPMLDNIYSSLCWSMSSLSAEICLLLAERLAERNADITNQVDLALTKMLIRKGASLTRKADAKLKDEEGDIKFRLAYETHEPVMRRLEALVSEYGVDVGADPARDKKTSLPKHRGLPDKRSRKSSLDMLATQLQGHHSSLPRHQRASMDTLHGFAKLPKPEKKRFSSNGHIVVTFGDDEPFRQSSGDVTFGFDNSPPPIVTGGQLPVISAVSGTSISEKQQDDEVVDIPTTLGPLKKDVGNKKRPDRRASGLSRGSKGSLRSLASSIRSALSGKRRSSSNMFADDDCLSDDVDDDIEAGSRQSGA